MGKEKRNLHVQAKDPVGPACGHLREKDAEKLRVREWSPFHFLELHTARSRQVRSMEGGQRMMGDYRAKEEMKLVERRQASPSSRPSGTPWPSPSSPVLTWKDCRRTGARRENHTRFSFSAGEHRRLTFSCKTSLRNSLIHPFCFWSGDDSSPEVEMQDLEEDKENIEPEQVQQEHKDYRILQGDKDESYFPELQRNVLRVKASDADAGLYGVVDYSLYDGFQSYEAPRAFQIDPHDGRICVSQDIDRERDPETYDLLVKARDGGGLSAQAFIRVELEDVNDNEPVFNPSTYVLSISGQTQPGTEIVNVLATDRDSGVYGRVAYELVPSDLSSLFTIDSTTEASEYKEKSVKVLQMNCLWEVENRRIIYLTSTLSHLESTTLLLMVCARDGGGLTSVTNADVTIHILQTTLAPAEFERPKYTFSVYEDVPEDSPVGTVKAKESLNSSEPIFYRISSGDLHGKFSIHPWLGTIRTQKPLDHETQPVVVLTVQAQLGSSPACSTTEVNLTVIDVNDNHPVFPKASDEVKIPQSTLPGTAVYRAHAEDKDSGWNGFIRYSIASQNPSLFSIDSGLGVVYLNDSLGGAVPRKHTLTLMAQDLGVPPRASLFMLTIVIEEQELSPSLIFGNLVYQVQVSESLSLMTQILQIQAYPLGPQRRTSRPLYSLEPGTDAAAFALHPDTGWIYLRRQLDYESTQTYNFRVFARIPEDRLSQNVSTSVIVHVLDENDNSPTFLHDVLFLKLEESPLPQGVIGKITAIDRDAGKNGQLSYFLLSDGKFFKMNPHTGELISWVALDHEHQGHHQVTVLVTDHGSPPRNASMVVYVSVTDINDNRPYFPQCLPGKELHIKVLEGQPINMLVTTVFAKDLDEGNNAEVIYSVSSEDRSDHFKIDANSGEIRTTTILSYDYRPSYRMIVIASDQGVPSLQGQAVINIQVIPLSKGRATISQNIRHLVIPENLKPAKIMSLIKSPDHFQQHHNGKLHFSIAADDQNGHFEIDSSTGDLFLSKELDYEMTSHYLFRVVTKDHSKTPPLYSTVFLSVAVEDQNDHSPSFQDDFIVISIAENVPIGTLVHVFNAKDGDGSFLNSRIQYFIESHHPGINPFLIHPSFGTLVTASPLDRERVPAVVLKITASDQAVNVTDRRLRSLIAKVVVLDVNDHNPNFTSFPITHVKEDATVGSLVHHITAQDVDEGRNGRVTYKILSGNENMAFTLDESSGLLMTTCSLDYEMKTQHVLTLLALDGGIPALSSSQTLTITVLDVNDEAPVFKQHLYPASVKENQNPGEFVTRVEAMDRDSGINSKLHFEIMPGASFGLFEINPETGEVVTTATLDREVQEVFTLQVLVRDGGVPSLSGTTTILCTVEDENDHAPKIIVPTRDIEVLENQEPGVVYTVLAFDMDTGNNGAVKYHIIDGNTDGYFAINETSGELITTCALDREHVSSFALVVLCSDLGDPSRSSIVQLQVRVLDDNDHSPSFPTLHYQSFVREDAEVGTVVFVLSTVDKDEGLNGQTEYLLTDEASGAFAIDPVAGTLRTVRTLDREARSQYIFTAMARDCSVQGSRSTTVIITVHITDINDNNPVWEQNPFDIFLSSQSPVNQTTAILRASDPDLGPNGTVIFSFAETQSVFSINKYTGEIQLQQNPSSEHFPIWLQLQAMDQGVPARTALGLLVIHMEGADVKMSFSHHLYKGIVTENCEAGTSIVTVKAFAPDSIRDSIKYSIFSGNEDGVFSLCSNSVTAHDSKLSALLGADGAPDESLGPTSDWGPSAVGSTGSTLVSRRFLKTSFLHYLLIKMQLTDSPASNRELAVKEPKLLDFEVRNEVQLIVLAESSGHRAYSKVIILIQDANDNLPCFGQSVYQVSVSEGQFHNAHIIQNLGIQKPPISLESAKETGIKPPSRQSSKGSRQQVRALSRQDLQQFFPKQLPSPECAEDHLPLTSSPLLARMFPPVGGKGTRRVFAASELYCHAHPDPHTHPAPQLGQWGPPALLSWPVLEVLHLHYGVSCDETFKKKMRALAFPVFITPPSDACLAAMTGASSAAVGPPTSQSTPPPSTAARCMTKPLLQIESLSNAKVASSQVSATDLDSGFNGLIEYSILSGNQGKAFQIDALNGVITANGILDYAVTNSYSLIVQATDKGMPRLSGTSVVKIQVADVNDNAPAFLPLEAVEIAENSLPGVIVTRISVHDADLNSAFIFSLAKESNPGNKFAIDQKSGAVVLVKALNFEEAPEYELLIQISDSVHHTEGVLTVRVLDVNDNPPVFSQDSYQATTPESTPVGHSVLTVAATDLESSEDISYRILSSSEEFSIDPKNGTIFTINPVLLLDKKLTIQLLVEASDGGIPDLRALTLVEIKIQDMNNYAPEFAVEYYNLSLSEDAQIGGTLVTFSTTDHDWAPENTQVEYSIISGNSQNNFHVETSFIHSEYPFKQVGYLVLLHNLDREASASHQLVILASDHGCPPRSSTAIVSIEVLDVNDNPPKFSSPKYHAHVKESTPVGSHITAVSANDRDVGVHAEIIYHIISGNEKGHFYLEERTGALYLTKPLDYEETIRFTLTIQASDEEKKHFSFAVVFISVLDDNDHEPQFMFPSLNCVVPENLPIFSTVCSVNALDFDAGPYGELTYSILSPCSVTHGVPPVHDPFLIDPLTGDIHAKQVLDYENDSKYCLTVQAKDKGDLTASLMVWVEIEGIDEFEPIFTQDQYFFNLPENNNIRQLIGRVEASDADAGIDGVILYSLETPSPFFSVNKTNGNIYLTRALPVIGNQVSREDTIEMKIIAHSPKQDSKVTSCTVFVNVSFSLEGKRSVVSASSFSISLTVSFLVVLFLVFILIVLILRYKQKDAINNYKDKKISSSLDISLQLTRDTSMLKPFQTMNDSSNEAVPVDSMPEWLSLISIVEKDVVNLYRHSNSSGRCSVEGETAEDKEIQRINEHPYRKDSGSALSDRESRVPDSGIPRDSDQLSCLSGETDVAVTVETAETNHTLEEGDGGEGCGAAYVQNSMLPQTLKKREFKASILAEVRREPVFIAGDQEARRAAPSTQRTSDPDERGNYHWDYLLRWEPKFQPLASVFNDIAKLKDEHLHTPGIPKEKKSLVFPPPLITAIAQPGIKAVPPRMPAVTSGQVLQKYPHSPLLYHLNSLPEAMTPSFSPSLSLLMTQTPVMTPLLSHGELLGTRLSDTCHELKAEDEVQM
ncbi:protocadherin-23 [Saccopteryx leptura]|uniref:protocadherin-23 n=1 Tax=Saccopteryx leptura TaxID=249018 RepID=UPI00339CA200